MITWLGYDDDGVKIWRIELTKHFIKYYGFFFFKYEFALRAKELNVLYDK